MSNSEGWDIIFRILFWIPQGAWGLVAIGIFGRAARRSKLIMQWQFLVAYSMVAGVIIMLAKFFGVPPFPPAGGYSGPYYSAFRELGVPSFFALVVLVFMHLLVVARANIEGPASN